MPRRVGETLGRALLVVTVVLANVALPAHAQNLTRENLERGHKMLAQMHEDLVKYYYDSTFHGTDLQATYHFADSSLALAHNTNEMFAILASFAEEMHSSHTRFLPPGHVARVDYGFETQPYGAGLFVTFVRKDSDAEKKGLKRGDLVLAVDNFRAERRTSALLDYLYSALSPRPGKRLIVEHPDAKIDTIVAMAKITQGQRVFDYNSMEDVGRLIREIEDDERRPTHYYRELGDTVLIWRMPEFVYGDESAIDDMIGMAKKHRAVIFDLRRDRGGSVRTEKYLLGQFFNRPVQIGTMITRGKRDSLMADPARKGEPYMGLLVVLIDSWSASASEIFARCMQLESRAVIVGDFSMGAVETSVTYPHDVGFERLLSYALQVSVSDVVMSDGNRLEGVGVAPDSLAVPTGKDLAEQRDVAMAKALAIVGITRTPEEAALLSGWRKKKQ
jgi:carboxyl-terminal processing protease